MKNFKTYPKFSFGKITFNLCVLIGLLFFLPGYGQNSKPSVNSQKATNIKNLKLSTLGQYYEGVQYMRGIEVSYDDIFKNKEVSVEYGIITKHGDFFQPSKENNDLWYTFKSDSTSGLVTGGKIICKTGDVIDTLAVFSDIVYFTHPKLFGGWLVADVTPYGVSNTSLLSGQNLHSSSVQLNSKKENIKFSNKKVSFFKINRDYTLKFDSEPKLSTSVKK